MATQPPVPKCIRKKTEKIHNTYLLLTLVFFCHFQFLMLPDLNNYITILNYSYALQICQCDVKLTYDCIPPDILVTPCNLNRADSSQSDSDTLS